jgi:hypothetical protein
MRHDEVLDDLSALVAGDADAIAKHAAHLASCDDCRDARHEATQLAAMLPAAGGDYVAKASLVEELLAKLDAQVNVGAASVGAASVGAASLGTAGVGGRAPAGSEAGGDERSGEGLRDGARGVPSAAGARPPVPGPGVTLGGL